MINIGMTAEEKQHIEMIAKAPNWRIPSWYQSKLPQDYSNKWQGLKNRQQRAVWSNVIWLVAKCVTVASIRAGEETVSERLPCGRANGFTVLPDRVYRPYIMFFLFLKYAFLSFIWRGDAGAWQRSMKGVKRWLHSRGSKWLQLFTFDLKLFLCHFWALCFAEG